MSPTSTKPRFSLIPACATMPLTPRQCRWQAAALLILAAWVLAVLCGPTLLSQAGVVLNAHGHEPLYAHGHPFVDVRSWWGLPNALNVLSNLPLAVAGAWGWLALVGTPRLPQPTRLALRTFFGGMVLTGLASTVYHWEPNAFGLVLDRMGMAVTFAGALALAVAERVRVTSTRSVLVVTLLLGWVSAIMPLTQGNALPWAVVQFGGMVLIAWLASVKPLSGALGVSLVGLIAIYALAKLLELGDAAVFEATGQWVSGHSLKHGVAALAAWPVIRVLGQNAPANTKVSTAAQ